MAAADRHPAADSDHCRPVKGERELIRRLAQLVPPAPAGAIGFGHDVAALGGGPGGLLWTVDMLMDGVDFDSARHAWVDVGRKAMAVNLSDCAAAAVMPLAALCAVSLDERLSMQDALDLFRGAQECGAEYGCPIVGGDTNSWQHPTVISITVAARPDGDRPPLTRSGARPGDRIWLTGPVGGSLLGRHLRPVPRVREALEISRALAPRAAIDISDGLAIDLWHICEASGCGALILEEALELAIHPDARRRAAQTGRPPREHALYDGEDFELIVALPAEAPVETCRRLGLLPIGQFTSERELLWQRRDGGREGLRVGGWEHFRD